MSTNQPLRPRRWHHIVVVVALTIGVAACGGGDDNDASGDATEAREVLIELVAFKPEQLEVKAGATVTWQQRDPGAHTVTSGTVEQEPASVTQHPDQLFDSGRLSTVTSFQHTFDEPGTFPYFCSLHPATMRGEIRVT